MSNDRLKFRARLYSPNRGYYWVYSGDNLPGFFKECDGEKIEQWTGLYDSAGVEGQEIYTGDILQPLAYLKTEFGRAQVVFRRGSFGLDVAKPFIPEYTPLWGALKKSISAGNGLAIIGNIYENPELLDA